MHSPDRISPQVNLKLIQAFLMVAETRSFREAADHVNRSQSAVSVQIRQLEEQLGVALFRRTTRSVTLTAEGERLLGSARRAIGEMEQGIRGLMEVADMRRGRVTLACSPTIAPRQLPSILAQFEAYYPGVNIVLKELKSIELFESIRKGEADFGIGPVISDSDFDFATVLSDRVCALTSRHHLRGRKGSIALADLCEVPVIQFHPNTVLCRIMSDALRSQGLDFNVHYQCIQVETLVAL